MAETSRALAATLFAVALATPAGAQEDAGEAARERCYGVAPVGENDGVGSRDDPGSSAVDWQGDAWIWVEAGTCQTVAPPPQPDGTPRRGAIQPLDRDRP